LRLTDTQQLVLYSSLLGITNFGGSMLQQYGLVTVSAGKTGFITGMYVVFVPFFEYCLIPRYRHHFNCKIVLSVLLSFLGLYLLSGCIEEEHCFGTKIGMGEILVFISTFFWVASILVGDYGAKSVEVISLTLYEFIVATSLNFVFAYSLEPDNFVYPFPAVQENWHLIVIVGITEALAFGLSTLGQMYTPPTRATILFSMEAVVCAVMAYLILGERLSFFELVGAILMTLAALLSGLVGSADSSQLDSDEQLERDLEDFYEEIQRRDGRGKGAEDVEESEEDEDYGEVYQYEFSSKKRVKGSGRGGQRGRTGSSGSGSGSGGRTSKVKIAERQTMESSYETIDLSNKKDQQGSQDDRLADQGSASTSTSKKYFTYRKSGSEHPSEADERTKLLR
jgi:drug/metabolite transporter (DMT)-like permease